MSLIRINFFNKVIAGLILTVFLFFIVFGLVGGMQMDDGGSMGNCPFTAGLSVCNMNVFEHLRSWQSMLLSIRQESNLSIILIGLLAISLVILEHFLRHIDKNVFLAQFRYRSRGPDYFSKHFIFQEEFSQGILNPKLY